MKAREARLHILRALSEHGDFAFVYDSDLPYEVRIVLRDFCHEQDMDRLRDIRGSLDALYAEHGPPLLRCILELSYLVHTTHDLDDFLAPTFRQIAAAVVPSPKLQGQLVNELGNFAGSPHRATREIVKIFVNTTSELPELLTNIIRREAGMFQLRLMAAECVVQNRMVASYPAVIDLVSELCRINDRSTEWFLRRLKPSAELLGSAGTNALELAVEAFDRNRFGSQGSFVLSRFGNTFHRWFASHDVKPSIPWAGVLIKAWERQGKLENRDHLLSVLVDQWVRDRRIAKLVRNELKGAIRRNPNYLSSCSEAVAARVNNFVGAGQGLADSRPQGETIAAKAAEVSEEGWKSFVLSLPLEKDTGWALADALVLTRGGKGSQRIMDLARVTGHPKRLNGFFNRVLLPRSFQALPGDLQLSLLQHPEADHYVTTERLNSLLSAQCELQPPVRSRIEKLRDRLFRQFPSAMAEDELEKGGLE